MGPFKSPCAYFHPHERFLTQESYTVNIAPVLPTLAEAELNASLPFLSMTRDV